MIQNMQHPRDNQLSDGLTSPTLCVVVFGVRYTAPYREQEIQHESRRIRVCHPQHLPGCCVHLLLFSPNLWNETRLNSPLKSADKGCTIIRIEDVCNQLCVSSYIFFLKYEHLINYLCSFTCTCTHTVFIHIPTQSCLIPSNPISSMFVNLTRRLNYQFYEPETIFCDVPLFAVETSWVCSNIVALSLCSMCQKSPLTVINNQYRWSLRTN